MKPNAGDIYCVYNQRLGKYTASQITKLFQENDKELAVILILDWVGEKVLSLNELSDLKPLPMNFMFWNKEKYLLNVVAEVPNNFIFVGNIPPITDESTNTYGGWDEGHTVFRQMKWLEIPEDRRKAFKSASESKENISFYGQERNANTSTIFDSNTDFESAKGLSVFKCLYQLDLEKWHSDLYEYLESNPFILNLTIKGHNQKDLDFRKSHMHKLIIDITNVEELYLNDEIEELYLSGEFSDNFKIYVKDNGSELLMGFQKTVRLNCGCEQLSKLHCIKTEEVDISQIATAYPNLSEIRLWGKPGYIRNFAEIKSLKQLCSFTTVDMFGFCANDIPKPNEMPKLTWFWMSSLPEDAAKEAKRLFKGEVKNGLNLWIEKPRKSEWLVENLDNPFRSWDGQDNITPTNAKKAAAAYKKARGVIMSLIKNPPSDFTKTLASVVSEYTEAFNKMDKKNSFIETEEREQIYIAFLGLLDLVPAEIEYNREFVDQAFENVRYF